MSVSVDLYTAPLVCVAVPQIGCGCLAKPVLARLSDHPDIARAWLHHHGDVIAIEWLRELDADQQLNLLRAAFGGDRKVVRVTDASTTALLASFPNPADWYQHETIDQLSREEAHTLATRLLQRLSQARVPLPDGTALQCDLACALEEVLVADEAIAIEARLAQLVEVARNTLRMHLGPHELPQLDAWLTTAALLPESAS